MTETAGRQQIGRTRASAAGGSTLWAWAGAAAGVAGLAGIQASMAISAAYDPKTVHDPAQVAKGLGEHTNAIIVMHVTLMVATVLLPVFGAGLYRRLRGALPADSVLPLVAFSGLLLTAVATLMGTGLDTELIFGYGEDGTLSDEFLTMGSHWVGTIPWLWVGSGLTGVTVAVAALRHKAVPTWIGVVGLVLGGLALVTGMSPLQYMAGFPGPLAVALLGLGLALSRPRAL
ncbi:hypothetical protein [Actinocorallia sp. A-T 12471]|uniref:hypothetical protein n=1 Tax=Actinocorallia sp. A-T 12471 TaxID=3089813 RepID=UPI0029D30C9E|nr:hypothetical protein [Actinocorallia sp. A-T 12471]MDX6739063.1 hypothetical protein [Actinocorallia sp. A-T 12471]